MTDAVSILNEYKTLKEQEYEIHKKISELDTRCKLLDKYNVRLKDYHFVISYVNDDGKACLIPLDDLKEIEDLTNARLTSVGNYAYRFTWIHDIMGEDL